MSENIPAYNPETFKSRESRDLNNAVKNIREEKKETENTIMKLAAQTNNTETIKKITNFLNLKENQDSPVFNWLDFFILLNTLSPEEAKIFVTKETKDYLLSAAIQFKTNNKAKKQIAA